MNNTKVALFFGAGAEAKFNLPLGPSYTYETMLHKKPDMMEALKGYYPKGSGLSYSKVFMFQNGSHTLYEEFCNSLKKNIDLFEKEPCVKKAIENLENTDKDEVKEANNLIREILYGNEVKEGIYNIATIDKSKLPYPYSKVIDSLAYFGAIEKDFACIIDPGRMGINRFWRLINYFWSAFFTILLSLLDNSIPFSESDDYRSNKYKYVLEHLGEILIQIEDDDFYNEKKYKCKKDGINYYQVLSDKLQLRYVFTTNYTPIVKKYFKEAVCIYLAGELKMFEEINSMSVCEYSALPSKDWVFPFLHTQAPVKPIICRYQINQYSMMARALDDIETLVVIGYSFGEYDSHINAFIRDFVEDNGKRLVNYEYVGKEMNSDDMDRFISDKKKNIERALRVKNKENIQIIPLPKTKGGFMHSIECDILKR